MRKFSGLIAVTLLALAGVASGAIQANAADGVAYNTSPESNSRFLADYAARPDVVKLPDGLMYRVLVSGNGTSPINRADVVTVLYKGSLINGKVFDRSKPDMPAVFTAGNLIPGWVEALFKMKAGDIWELAIPAALGYGADGAGSLIPPNQTLLFVVKLDKVEYAP